MKRKKKSPKTKTLIQTLAAASIGGLLLFFGSKAIPVPSYTAIRVSGIDAPEMGRCGSEEAKKELEQTVKRSRL